MSADGGDPVDADVTVRNVVRNAVQSFGTSVVPLGDSVWIGLNGEHYNLLQRELRRRFPDTPVIVGTLANGSKLYFL